MLPLSIEKRISQPGLLERQFLNYLRMANAPIDQSKSIAYEVLFDVKESTARNNVEFFTGQLDQSLTNIRGSYVRPQSEHFLIYAIRGYRLNENSTQIPGGGFTNNEIPMLKGFTSETNVADKPVTPFQNSYLSISVNSVRMLKKVPLSEFDNEMLNREKGTMFLDQPILWEGQTELKLRVETNDSNNVFPGTVGESDSYLRFDLLGIGLI
jgi:hypothetical protein